VHIGVSEGGGGGSWSEAFGSRLRLPPARGSLGGTLLGISSFCLWHFAPTLQAAMMQQQLLLLVLEYSGGMQSEECGMYSKN
jgi:hypothetical protein